MAREVKALTERRAGVAARPAAARVTRFVRDVVSELKKVKFPNRKQTAVFTVVVLATVAVVGSLIYVFDVGLSAVLGLVLK